MIRRSILAVIVNSLVLWGLTEVSPGTITITWWIMAFLIPWLFLGILNTVLKPLLKLISLPLVVLTAWLFTWVINAIILYLLEFITQMFQIWDMVFSIEGWIIMWYIFTAFLLTVMNSIAHWLIKK